MSITEFSWNCLLWKFAFNSNSAFMGKKLYHTVQTKRAGQCTASVGSEEAPTTLGLIYIVFFCISTRDSNYLIKFLSKFWELLKVEIFLMLF
jgi:hypothetical protein